MRVHLLPLFLLFLSAPQLQADVRVEFSRDKSTIIVDGLDDASIAKFLKVNNVSGWEALARVRVEGTTDEETEQRPALLGEWRVNEKTIVFKPRFPFTAGVTYLVTLDKSFTDGKRQRFPLQLPKKDLTPRTKLERIFPTANKLPENQLRFYLQFSGPMSQGEAYANIKLLDAKGKPINDVFLELDEELWDPMLTRFTLLFDPGRIKRGLKPREDLGPTLEDGKSYTLVVNGQWRDSEGRLLIDKEYRKEFTAGPPDNEPINPKNWRLSVPASGSREPLQVRFPEPLDRALLQRVVWIVDDKNQKIDGVIQIGEEEKLWSFIPSDPWQTGTYRLVAETILEDLAANRIGRAFEVDVFKPVTKEVEKKTVEIDFEVKPAR